MWLREIFSDIKILWRSCADQQCSRNLHLCHWVPQMSKILLHQCLRKWVLPYFNTLPHDSVYIFHPLLRDPFPYLLMHYQYAKITPWFQGSLAMCQNLNRRCQWEGDWHVSSCQEWLETDRAPDNEQELLWLMKGKGSEFNFCSCLTDYYPLRYWDLCAMWVVSSQ